MNREETKTLVRILFNAYPQYYKAVNQEQLKSQVALYERYFGGYPLPIVSTALDQYIVSNVYPPTVAGLMNIIKSLEQGTQDTGLESLFDEFWQSVCGNVRFEDLREPNKRYARSQKALDDLGQSKDTIQSVVKGQYMKRMPEILEQLNVVETARQQLGEAVLEKLLTQGQKGALQIEDRGFTTEVSETGTGEIG